MQTYGLVVHKVDMWTKASCNLIWYKTKQLKVTKKSVHSNTTWLDWHCVQFSGRFHPYCQSALVLSVITRHSYVYLVFWRELSSHFGTWCGFSDSKKGRTLVIFLSHWWNWLWCGLVKCLRLSAASSPLQEGYRPTGMCLPSSSTSSTSLRMKALYFQENINTVWLNGFACVNNPLDFHLVLGVGGLPLCFRLTTEQT